MKIISCCVCCCGGALSLRWVIDTDSCTADLELEITVEAYSPAEEGKGQHSELLVGLEAI